MKVTPISILTTLAFLAVVSGIYVLLLPQCAPDDIHAPSQTLPIISVGPFYAITDQGHLYPAQTYRYRNEGPWVGNHTLVFALYGRAIFLTNYPLDYPHNTRRAICRAIYIPESIQP